ncbi:MAG TPA: LysM peptidoglycan-binding domain-containing protein [Rhabdochlamydiaceae bacterium]|jgi:LysM repeat protein|nr:LysM peptidoglycan-binding domain-containing protein [Rhabdochlamydiaceae bacterium]
MNRRDTIIIAVLLNAGLLIVLFATSVISDKTEEAVPTTVLSSSQPEIPSVPVAAAPIAPIAQAGTDQLDQLIQQYVTPQVPEKVIGQTVQTETQPNFLADLQALGADQAAPVMEKAPAIVEAQTAEPALREVKVKKGDVLEKIARQNHVSVNDIMKANKLSSTRLKIGQTLKIPGKIPGKLAKASTVAASGENAQYYTIKNGDNPWTIAVKHHMKVDELLKLNNMNEDKARRLKPGDRIRIQ